MDLAVLNLSSRPTSISDSGLVICPELVNNPVYPGIPGNLGDESMQFAIKRESIYESLAWRMRDRLASPPASQGLQRGTVPGHMQPLDKIRNEGG